MLAVALGTLYPLFMDALKQGKISVGPPYFDLVFGLIMLPAAFLMGVGPIARWRNATLPEIATRLKWAFAIAVAAGIVIPLLMGKLTLWIGVGLFLATWIVSASITGIVLRVGVTPQPGFFAKLRANSPSFYGMHLAHIGIAVFIVGVTMVKGYETERDIRMAPGEAANEGGYDFKFVSIGERPGPNYAGLQARFEVSKNGKLVEILTPEKRRYFASGQTMTEAGIASGITGDLYVSLGEPVEASNNGAWGVRIYVKPFIDWIWFGCIFMAMGGALALADKRYRIKMKSRQSAALTPTPPGTPPPEPSLATQATRAQGGE
jgi:cytochrome c-type biogenesis protein CcmF